MASRLRASTSMRLDRRSSGTITERTTRIHGSSATVIGGSHQELSADEIPSDPVEVADRVKLLDSALMSGSGFTRRGYERDAPWSDRRLAHRHRVLLRLPHRLSSR